MYGTLAGALAGRKIAFDRSTFTATVDGRIAGAGRALRIESIVVHYDLTVPAEARESAERSHAARARACPAPGRAGDAIAARGRAVPRGGGGAVPRGGGAGAGSPPRAGE